MESAALYMRAVPSLLRKEDMTITELIGQLLAELIKNGDSYVYIHSRSEGQPEELRAVDSTPGTEGFPGQLILTGGNRSLW